ncbi:MMPL family transporter [Glutamicibacter halophytocola]|uniref:MMPL family transporter n=1 Tax=Glutamicibacter halophytocola TaxID=1933880 RepID=A0ABX5YAE7_9MICC|nr:MULTISPECIES: MMPL family transporter [Glutamicibacter]MBF6670446.1 MMPL family transporter [Glutamicibacter sp. FBE19]QDY66636.1 MMPL family transporter [Glutamicibacter halophytocola]
MSLFLSRVGRFSARHRWVVIATWLAIFVIFAGVFAAGKGSSPDGSANAAEQAAVKAAPELQLVFNPHSGDVLSAENAKEIKSVLAQAQRLPDVETVSDPLDAQRPFISKDQSVAVATLGYGQLTDEQRESDYAAALELQQNAPDSLGVELGGNLVPLGAPEQGPGEGVGVILAFVVLAITFGSLLAAGANLLLAVFGLGTGLLGIMAYGTLKPLDSNSIILAAMLGLAVGIDYTLFIISRYRAELRSGRSIPDAIARATGTAGTAVVFAGLTVIVALAALLVANISTITQMGMAAAFVVAVSVLISLTLLPALLGLMGTKVLSRRARREIAEGIFISDESKPKTGFFTGWVSFVVKRPVASLIGGLVILLLVAAPMLTMKTAFNIPGGTDPLSTERAAYNLVVDEFGGIQSPLVVTAQGNKLDSHKEQIEQQILDVPGVQQIMSSKVTSQGHQAQFIVAPDAGPIDQSTKDIVHELRADADSIEGVHLEVTGETAMGIDQDQQMKEALVRYVIVIVTISLVLLIVLFRSLLVPLIATVGYLLSVGAAFGASVAVFQWGWLDPLIAAPQGDPMMSMLPLILVGVLFGLAMDYQVFLVSRIQEMDHKGLPSKQAIIEGFSRSAPVVAAAAGIMTAVFAGFASSSFAIGASIAFGLLIGVVADAFLVRMVLMPAALSILGNAAWWMPRWLDRIVPNVDAEGHSLDRVEQQQEGRSADDILV